MVDPPMPTQNHLHQAQLLLKKGIQQSRQGDCWGAIESFDRALQSHPDHADIYGQRCVARHQAGDKPGAITDCQQAANLYKEQGNTQNHQYALQMLAKLQQ
jgi:Flp pilus assembly protein TadD